MTPTIEDLGLTPGVWNIDPAHSEIAFSIRHLMTKVRGSFTEFTGQVTIGEDPKTSSARAEIKMASVETRNSTRDADVRSSNILDVEAHPTMTFEATGVRAEGDMYLVDGDLTIKGVARPVTLTAEFNGASDDPWGGFRAGFSATTSINRRDWGVEFNVPMQGDRVLLGDHVDIQLEIQAVRAA